MGRTMKPVKIRVEIKERVVSETIISMYLLRNSGMIFQLEQFIVMKTMVQCEGKLDSKSLGSVKKEIVL